MSKTLDGAWNIILQNLQKQLNPQSFETWFMPTRQVGYSDNAIDIEVPNIFFRDWLVDHYREQINQASKELGIPDFDISFTIGSQKPAPKEAEKKGGFLARTFEKFTHNSEFSFNERYNFDNFVVGTCNRFAHAACHAVAENPAKAYNPLFIYGGVGLGKTHLMQAIGQHLYKKNPRLNILYISSEKFTNQLIRAIQNRTTQKFREKYRHQDLLLIDDIQFISGKESTQEEFFHTFNALYDAHKQIVLSSDRPPKEITSLEHRLVSRFEWGLVTDIQAPDLETRIAILRKKMEIDVAKVPDDVLFFIADNIKSNIRQLEGALVRVIAYSSLIGKNIDLNVSKEVLKELNLEKNAEINVERIQKTVAEYFGITTNDMRKKKRVKRLAYPRQIAMYISRELTNLSLAEIGGLFGGRDHTTVIHGCEKIDVDMKNNPHIKDVVAAIITKVKTVG